MLWFFINQLVLFIIQSIEHLVGHNTFYYGSMNRLLNFLLIIGIGKTLSGGRVEHYAYNIWLIMRTGGPYKLNEPGVTIYSSYV